MDAARCHYVAAPFGGPEWICSRRGVDRARSWLLLLALPLLLTACNQVGGATLTFWDVVWGMVFFFFWFMAIWIFINIFADIFRRDDMTGASKVIWLIALIFLPFLGALIYLLTRPKVTAQDVSHDGQGRGRPEGRVAGVHRRRADQARRSSRTPA